MTHRGLLSTCCRRLRAEGGFAVPTVMLAVIAAAGIASSAVIASVSAQTGTVRDQNTKAALAAAEAGIANAMMRFNRVRVTSPTNACAPVGGMVTDAAGWCPQVITGMFDRGTYSYRVHTTPAVGAVPGKLTVVSTGTVDGVSRRVRTEADTITGNYRPFAGNATVIGLNSIAINGGSTINADVATNGNVGLDSNTTLNCDYAQVGVGRGFSPRGSNSTATCAPTPGEISLPPVNPGDVMVNNSNARIGRFGLPGVLDPIQGRNNCNWNPVTLMLDLGSGCSLTLGTSGGEFNYAFCQIRLRSNSYLHVTRGATVRIYFGSPDSPPCLNQTQPLIVQSNSKIQPTGPSTGAASLALFGVGSDTRATSITIDSNAILFDCDQTFVLYAPRTSLTVSSNANICGGIGARSITVDSNSTITASNAASEFELPNTEVAAHYSRPADFVECTATAPPTGGAPDVGC